MNAEQIAERQFPIIPYNRAEVGKGPHPTRIPWHIADLAYSVYSSRHGRGQSLERLAERGGFHAGEMDDYLPDWRERCSALTAHDQRIAEMEGALREIGIYAFAKTQQPVHARDDHNSAECSWCCVSELVRAALTPPAAKAQE